MSDRALQGLSTGELKRLHEASQGGFKKKGYDDSNDVSVDYDMSVNDMRKSQKINYRHYDPDEGSMKMRADGTSKNAQWGLVRDSLGLKDVNSENDLNAMYRAVNNEYTQRMIDSSMKGMQAKVETPAPAAAATAPAPEAKAEPEAVAKPKVEPTTEVDPIRPFEPQEKKPQINGFAGSTWNPEGGTEAPGLAEYSKAKEKAQSFQAGAPVDYSFNAGSYGSKPAATPSGAYGSGDAYGNVPAADMNAEHEAEQLKNSHLAKAKTALGSL